MKKALFNILFVICHLIASFCGFYLEVLFFDPFYPHPRALLMGMLVFLPLSYTYLILMRKNVIGLAPSIVCFVGNLLFHGFPTLLLLPFRTISFTLSPHELLHDFELIVLIVQCSVFISTLRCRQKKGRSVKEFKTPPCVIARTQRIRYPIFYTSFKKHYCPNCTTRLRLIKKSKMIVSDTSETNNDLYFGTGSPEANVRFIWKEFQCPSCKTEFTIENIKKIEQNNQ